MTTMNIRPAFSYRFLDSLKGAGIFFGIMALVIAAVCASFIRATISFGNSSYGTLTAYGFSAGITVFVFGICTVREDLRLCLQHGVSRRTVFAVQLLSASCICLILAVAGELLLAAAQAAMHNNQNLNIGDLYQVIYTDISVRELTFVQHLESAFLNLSLLLSANMAGMFISLMFYRLNKAWTIVVAVGAPLFFFAVLPILLSLSNLSRLLSRPFAALANWLLSDPWAGVLFFMLTAAVLAVFCLLMVRHAPIKASKG